MRRYKDIESLFALIALLTFSEHSTPTTLAASLVLEATPIHAGIEQPQQRCQILDIAEAGRYWLVTTSSRPATTPALLVLGLEGSDPRTAGRVEMTLLDFAEPGEHAVCRTSELTSEAHRWTLEWAGDLIKAGDEFEIEVVVDPLRPQGDLTKAGDEFEIEVVIDP